MVLITGGASNGKSSYAEDICMRLSSPRYYLATMLPCGSESLEKIEKHRQKRKGKGFITIEKYTDIAETADNISGGTLLMECISNLTANEMFDDKGNVRDPVEKIINGAGRLKEACDDLVVVTNEVGACHKSYGDTVMQYIRAMGAINAGLAAMADTVYELVCGQAVLLKGEKIQ